MALSENMAPIWPPMFGASSRGYLLNWHEMGVLYSIFRVIDREDDKPLAGKMINHWIWGYPIPIPEMHGPTPTQAVTL